MRPSSIIDVAEFAYDVATCRRLPRAASLLVRYLAHLPAGARILDLGAGTGEIAAEIERATGASVTACDVDLGELQRGIGRPRGGRLVGDAQALPFGTRTFQAAYLIYVLHRFHPFSFRYRVNEPGASRCSLRSCLSSLHAS